MNTLLISIAEKNNVIEWRSGVIHSQECQQVSKEVLIGPHSWPCHVNDTDLLCLHL